MRDFIERIRITKERFGTRLDMVVSDYLKTVKGQIKNTDLEIAQDLINKILKADYVNDTDSEKLYIDKKHWVKLIYGSSVSGCSETYHGVDCFDYEFQWEPDHYHNS